MRRGGEARQGEHVNIKVPARLVSGMKVDTSN
jgi:hypothetical protein